MIDFTEKLYCNELVKENAELCTTMRREIEAFSDILAYLSTVEMQMEAFKGYEPKFDVMSKELEVRGEILHELRSRFGLGMGEEVT